MSSRVVCVWLPNWPIQRVQAEEPQLAEAPLVLSARDPRRGMLVAAANLIARGAGIKPNMRLSEATALATVQIREYEPDEDLEVLFSLAEQAQQFSPIVGLEQLDKALWAGRHLHQPQSLLLDATGLANLFGGEAELLSRIARWLQAQNYFGCLALAGSVGAAWALANYALRGKDPADASNYFVPDCRIYLASPGEDAGLDRLPLSALRLPIETVLALRRLGIQRINQLETLPRDGMATRLGEQLLIRWDQIRGRRDEPIVSLHSRPDWCLEQSLEYPTQQYATLCELLQGLNHELAQRLADRGEGALRLVCRLSSNQAPPLVIQLGLFRPTHDAAYLQSLLTGQLEQRLRFLGSAPIGKVSLQATLTAPLVWRQADLFDGGEAASRGEMARLVDMLSGRLGRKRVLKPLVRREAQPELAFRLQPLTGRRKDGAEQATIKKLSSRQAHRRAEPSRDDPLRRPSNLFRQAVSTEFRQLPDALANQSVDSERSGTDSREHGVQLDRLTCLAAALNRDSGPTLPVLQFKFAGRWHSIIGVSGPERLESGWWRGPSARRDYYRVATAPGSWWWLFRDLTSGDWYVHGYFD